MGRTKAPATAPINAPFPAVRDWVRAEHPRAQLLLDDVAWSPTFSEQSFPAGPDELRELWTTGGDVSWLGGPAVLPLPLWPRRSDGTALAHVMTIALADAARVGDVDDKAAWPRHDEGLPTTGALELFHDTLTFGWDPEDGLSGAWLVRWVPEPDRSGFAAEPDDLDTPGTVCQAGLFLPGWTPTPAGDFVTAPSERFTAVEAVTDAHRHAWMRQRELPESDHRLPVTHLYGHAQHDTSPALAVVRGILPLGADDRHRLVLEIESWTHLNGWFGDAGTLQVWMRAGDLAARRFEHAWCMIRTD